MAKHELVEPFDVDGGELDGLTPQHVFALGVEWQMFRSQLETGNPVSVTVMAENADRLKALCERNNRVCRVRLIGDDHMAYRTLDVQPAFRP